MKYLILIIMQLVWLINPSCGQELSVLGSSEILGHLKKTSETESIDSVLSLYSSLIEKNAVPDDERERMLNSLGYHFLNSQRLVQAVRVFDLNISLHPGSYNGYDSKGEAMLAMGEVDSAIHYYNYSLDLNPENKNAITILNRMKPLNPVGTLSGFQDEGSFTYYINEEPIGSASIVWPAEGSVKGQSELIYAGQRLPGETTIQTDNKGAWHEIIFQSFRGNVHILRNGFRIVIKAGNEVSAMIIDPGTLLMEDMMPSLMSLMVDRYNHNAGGEQTFPLFFIPAVKVDASLEYKNSFRKSLSGKEHQFRNYQCKMPPIYTVTFTVDESNRVCMVEYPAQHGLFVRNGCEDLLQEDPSHPTVSSPVFKVSKEENISVTMPDGISLSCDIYRPDTSGRFPVILLRTPYDKANEVKNAMFYARRGYVFVVQDVRGRYASGGTWEPFFNEKADGQSTIEWIAAQSWSTGDVGMMGNSYQAICAWAAASTRPKQLKTIISGVSPPGPFDNFPYENGVFSLGPALWWSNYVQKNLSDDASGKELEASFNLYKHPDLSSLPVNEVDRLVTGQQIPWFREWLKHPTYDAFWQRLDAEGSMKGYDLPVLHQSGWFDGNGIGAFANYDNMISQGKQHQTLIIGPWGHMDADNQFSLSGIDWGAEATVDLQDLFLRWMDRWLKGVANGVEDESPVSLFVMDRNEWITGDRYPLPETKEITLYLANSGEHSCRLKDPGELIRSLPSGNSSSYDTYDYNPGDPTPGDPKGREDLLVYQTPPFDETKMLAGPLEAVIYASSTTEDTDWILRLLKITREGDIRLLNAGQGILRASMRHSASDPEKLIPGEINEYHLNLWHTAMEILPGERLMLVVSSALFPRFARSLNTFENPGTSDTYKVAKQTIYHSSEYPSRVILPVREMP